MKLLAINPAIVAIHIFGGYSRYRGSFVYHGKGVLEIKNIPDNTELTIKGRFKECRCGGFRKYHALWKDGILYDID